jgi:glycerol-3-phosphate cytidylyltransferase-like family protein
MTTVVIMPGGFHPFHPGHLALYQSAQRAFPDAEVYVAATNDKSDRPFDISEKQKIAYAAGVEPGHFVQVKSPFQAIEIAGKYNPDRDTIIFVRSEKDAANPPHAGVTKKDGSPGYLQPLLGAKRLEPFRKHAYMAYLPTIEFGPGAFTSASQIRAAWPKLNPKRRLALIMSLYPSTQQDPAGAQDIVSIFDQNIGVVDEDLSRRGFLRGAGAAAGMAAAGAVGAKELAQPTIIAIVRIGDQTKQFNLGTKFTDSKQAEDFVADFLDQQGIKQYTIEIKRGYTNENQGWAATYEADGLTAGTGVTGGMHATYQDRYNQPTTEDYVEERRS